VSGEFRIGKKASSAVSKKKKFRGEKRCLIHGEGGGYGKQRGGYHREGRWVTRGGGVQLKRASKKGGGGLRAKRQGGGGKSPRFRGNTGKKRETGAFFGGCVGYGSDNNEPVYRIRVWGDSGGRVGEEEKRI